MINLNDDAKYVTLLIVAFILGYLMASATGTVTLNLKTLLVPLTIILIIGAFFWMNKGVKTKTAQVKQSGRDRVVDPFKRS